MKSKLLNFLWCELKKKSYIFHVTARFKNIYRMFFIEKVPFVLKQKITTFHVKMLGPSILLETNSP